MILENRALAQPHKQQDTTSLLYHGESLNQVEVIVVRLGEVLDDVVVALTADGGEIFSYNCGTLR